MKIVDMNTDQLSQLAKAANLSPALLTFVAGDVDAELDADGKSRVVGGGDLREHLVSVLPGGAEMVDEMTVATTKGLDGVAANFVIGRYGHAAGLTPPDAAEKKRASIAGAGLYVHVLKGKH